MLQGTFYQNLVRVLAPQPQSSSVLYSINSQLVKPQSQSQGSQGAYPLQNKRQRNHSDGNKPQRAGRPPNPERLKHLRSSQRKSTSERTPEEGVAGEDARDVSWVRLSQVIQDGLEGEVEAGGEERGADDRYYPVYAVRLASWFVLTRIHGSSRQYLPLSGRPCKDKETNRDTDGTHLAGN